VAELGRCAHQDLERAEHAQQDGGCLRFARPEIRGEVGAPPEEWMTVRPGQREHEAHLVTRRERRADGRGVHGGVAPEERQPDGVAGTPGECVQVGERARVSMEERVYERRLPEVGGDEQRALAVKRRHGEGGGQGVAGEIARVVRAEDGLDLQRLRLDEDPSHRRGRQVAECELEVLRRHPARARTEQEPPHGQPAREGRQAARR
jgi:hypothetical protein